MNLRPIEARALIAGPARRDRSRSRATLAKDRDVLVAPPDVLIPAVAQALAGSSIAARRAEHALRRQAARSPARSRRRCCNSFGVTHVILGPFGTPPHLSTRPTNSSTRKCSPRLRHRMSRSCASARPQESARRHDARCRAAPTRKRPRQAFRPKPAATGGHRVRAGLGHRHRPDRDPGAGAVGARRDPRSSSTIHGARARRRDAHPLRRQRHSRQC